MGRRNNSLESVASDSPEMFGEGVPVEQAETMSVPTSEVQVSSEKTGFLLACGDGLELSTERCEIDVQESACRMLEDVVRIGKRLHILKAKLDPGGFTTYMDERFPLSYRTGREAMLIARRVLGSKLANVRQFLTATAGQSKTKAALIMGISDDELQTAEESGELLGRSLEEVGELSYRQLKEEIRKLNRDLERTRRHRDTAETKNEDLKEEVSMLRSGEGQEDNVEITPLQKECTQLSLLIGKMIIAAEEAPDEEITRDGPALLALIMQEVTVLGKVLQPWVHPESPHDEE